MNCVIKNSIIRGPVNIGDDVVVENSFTGPFTSIYDHSRVIDCHVENSVLMESVDLEHVGKMIDSSIIGLIVKLRLKTIKILIYLLGK